MDRFKMFFDKVLKNEVLKENFSKLEMKKWDNLSFNEKVSTFKIIVDELSSFYPELGTPNFEFIFMDDNFSGEQSRKGVFINVKMLAGGNHFEVMATCLHELRHFFQTEACNLYKNHGIVHELFSEKEINDFIENSQRSIFFTADNYMELDSDNNTSEYYSQPVEYDAESFSYTFMKHFSKNFLKDKYDIMNCKYACDWFLPIIELYKGRKNDIVDFSKIYRFDYLDRVRENRVEFKKQKKQYETIEKLFDKIPYLDDREIFILLSPCFLEKYDDEKIVDLLNLYLSYNECNEKIEYIDDGYYLDGLLLNFDSKDTYEIIEPVFFHVAEKKVKEIANQNLENLKFGFEKEIKINMCDERNIIKESKNPLLYKLQPYVLFERNFIRDEYMKLIHSIDSLYEGSNNYFNEFAYYIKKYDNIPLIKKVEIMMGKSFKEIYNEMLEKMKENLSERRKNIK